MMMLASTLLSAVAATLQAAAAPPPSAPAQQARAQTQAVVRIIQAAEVRKGLSDVPHQRSVRRDELGRRLIMLDFE
jgi:hypothetical protein